jgi:hypothetical protein
MVDPLPLALTNTPSIASCPAVTFPDSAGPACAGNLPVPESQAATTRQPMLVTIEMRDMTVSRNFAFCSWPRAA